MAAPIRNTVVRILGFDCSVLKIVRRGYARGFRRMPLKVISPEEEREKVSKYNLQIRDPRKNANVSYLPEDPVQKNLKSKLNKPDKVTTVDYNEYSKFKSPTKVYRTKGHDIEYARIEESDMSKKFNQIVMNANSRKQKGKIKTIVLEGKRLIIDALKANGAMKYLFISRMDVLDGFPARLIDCPVYRVPHKHLKVWSETDASQGIIAVFEMPKEGETTAPRTEELPVTLICDRVTDPGNLGAIIRSAAAVGCSKLITMPGCVDVWNRKVLRAGAGGHFRQPILPNMSWSQLINYIPEHSSVFMADPRRPSKWLIDTVSRRGQENTNMEEGPDDETSMDDNESDDSSDLGDDYDQTDELKSFKKLPLDVSLYSEVDMVAKRHIVLLVGGDTIGFSPQARKFVFDYNGQCILLPMATGISTLNSSVVTSVLLYEIHKQLQKTKSE